MVFSTPVRFTSKTSRACSSDSPPPLLNVDCGAVDLTEFRSDVWFTYTSTCDENILFDMTDYEHNGSQDTVIAVYSDGSGTCPAASTGNQVGCSDDGGFWGGAGGQINVTNTAVGTCFLIRVAGFFDQDGAEFLDQKLNIGCGVVETCDPPTLAVNPHPSEGTASPTSRHLGVVPGLCGGAASSLQIELTANPDDGGAGVGDVWFAGAPSALSDTPLAPLQQSTLACQPGTPHSEVWSGAVWLKGGAIRPNATYNVSSCDAGGGNCSTPIVVSTGVWGDARGVGGLVPDGATNFADINGIVGKFGGSAGAPSIVFSDLRGAAGFDTDGGANFADVNAAVGAFGGTPYGGGTATCP